MSENKGTNAAVAYERTHYKVVPFELQRDFYEEVLEPAAAKAGEPIATYIKKAVAQRIERLKND